MTCAAASVLLLAAPGPAAAAPGCAGVSVVVDFAALGAPGLRGCATTPPEPGTGLTGLDALRAADVAVEGTAQWGDAFVCRVEGRPGPTEDVVVDGARTVRAACVRTPPQDASWSVWTATEGEGWQYASVGVTDLALTGTDALGLVFSTGDGAPQPPGMTPDLARSGALPTGWEDRPPATDPAGASTGSDPADDGAPEATGAGGTADAEPGAGGGPGVVPLLALAVVAVGAALAVRTARRGRSPRGAHP